jgi:hypothetical protein
MMRIGRSLPVGLFLTLSALGALIWFEATEQGQPPRTEAGAPIAVPARAGNTAISGPPNGHDAWFREILARPLFSPDRKPVVTSARTAAGLPRLTGIVVAGSRRVAIFAANAGGRPNVVEAGSQLGIYRVLDITDSSVTVAGPAGTSVIKPVFDPAAANAVKSPLAPPRPEPPRPVAK